MPAAVSTAAIPAKTAVSRTSCMNPASGSLAPTRANNHKPAASAGTSMTAPTNSPLRPPQRGGNAAGGRLLSGDVVGSGTAVSEEGQPTDHRSIVILAEG